jgi:hypothetical protein
MVGPVNEGHRWIMARNAGAGRRGMTLVDVVVVSVVVVLAGVTFLQCAAGWSEKSNRVKCGANLKQIHTALSQYGDVRRAGNFPRTRYDKTRSLTQYTGAADSNPFQGDSEGDVRINDQTASLFLLVRAGLNPAMFVCPSTEAVPDNFGGGTVDARGNFTSEANLSYSLTVVYPDTRAVTNQYRMPGPNNFVWLADMNPGTKLTTDLGPNSPPKDIEQSNSQNHSQEGQNVLYNEGSVSFVDTPCVGPNADNIYTSRFGTNMDWSMAQPKDRDDNVLLPVATLPPPARRASYLVWIIVAIGLIAAGVVAVLLVRSSSKAKQMQMQNQMMGMPGPMGGPGYFPPAQGPMMPPQGPPNLPQ